MPPMLMKHDVDPADALRKQIGSLDNVTVMFSQVLIAIYQRPETTKSGIILTSKTLDEDIYQGKIGLVLKLGPRAFEDEGDLKFHGERVRVGDWIAIRPSDGWQININKTECRMLRDVDVKLVVSTPDAIW